MEQTMLDEICFLWSKLTQNNIGKKDPTLLKVPFPYIVPGGRFKEMYYWDTYFIILGLIPSGHMELAKGMVENLLYLYQKYKIIPNGNRTYYLSRSQPPMLTSMINLFPDKKWRNLAMSIAEQEYQQVWMKNHLLKEYQLNRYIDNKVSHRPEQKGEKRIKAKNRNEIKQERAECESGWDFTDRFDSRCSDFLPIDLNCLLYKYEKDLGKKDEAKKRKKLIMELMWDQDSGFFYDYDTKNQEIHHYPTLAAYFTMWCSLATTKQAEELVANLEKFEAKGGLTTSLHKSGKQWDYPNGWAPLQWIVIEGLMNYGYNAKAKEIAKNWSNLCESVFKEKRKLYEKYNVVGFDIRTPTAYALQEGFGWTNGVYKKIQSQIFNEKVNCT